MASPSSLAAYPSDALYGAYLQHHNMLLQHHMEFLTSSLAQVRILQDQQKEMARKFEAQREAAIKGEDSTARTEQKDDSQIKQEEASSSSGSTLTQRKGTQAAL